MLKHSIYFMTSSQTFHSSKLHNTHAYFSLVFSNTNANISHSYLSCPGYNLLRFTPVESGIATDSDFFSVASSKELIFFAIYVCVFFLIVWIYLFNG